MKKFLNVRLPVIAALSLCAGITAGLILKFYKQDILFISAAIPLAAVIFVILLFVKGNIAKPLIFVLLPLILFIAGGLNSYFAIVGYEKSEIIQNGEYAVCGRVIEKGIAGEGEYIIIDNIAFDGRSANGKMFVYLSQTYGDFCEEGYTVEFVSNITKNQAFSYGTLNYNAENDVKYFASVFYGLDAHYGFSLFGSVRNAIRKTLTENLDRDIAAICFAMLTGNTQLIESDVMESFRYGGVAHIFAVSGLHIGIIFAILSFICKRLHINRYVSAVICLSFIFLYSGVCGFTLSSLRAAIMCTVATIAKLFYQKNDGLNALSVAVIIILFLSPLSLVSVGFLLSVSAVGGIFFISKNVERLLTKIKMPKVISEAAGISIGAQLGTLPVMLSSFGYVSGAGLLLNILIIPLLSAAFVVVFLSVFISIIIPAAAPCLSVAVLPMQAIISFLVNAGFEKTLISGLATGLFIPLYLVVILFISDKLNMKSLNRTIAVGCSLTFLIIYVLLTTVL